MSKLCGFKVIHRGGVLIKNTFKYLLEHPSGVKKEEDYKKLRAKYDCIWYMIVSGTVITIYKNFNNRE